MRVVVTGMGVISPVGNDVNTYWKNLVDGVCGITAVDEELKDKTSIRVWARVKDFDPDQFGVEAAVSRKYDKFTQYAIAAAKQAMDQAGLVAGENVKASRLGVYFGSGIGGIQKSYEGCVALDRNGEKYLSPMFMPSIISNMAAGYVAIKHNAQGPCISVATACATSTHAIGEAYRAIKHGYADAIITGGSEAPYFPLGLPAFGNMKALTRSGDPMRASLPFNRNRGGFVLGEGAGALVLESYDHAVKRGATILAEVCGYSSSCDAYHPTAPCPDGSTQAVAIREAAAQAKACGRRDVIYVNAHGTGTALNDSTEIKAIRLALGKKADAAHVSSTKGCLGHMMGAAGAAEAIACILALRDGVVPPTIGLDDQDPECDMDCTPNVAVKAGLTLALSDSLGFGGHNACLAFRKI